MLIVQEPDDPPELPPKEPLSEPLEPPCGLKVTLVAPPHWLFWIMEPSELQECVSVRVEPSGMPYSQSTSVSELDEMW